MARCGSKEAIAEMDKSMLPVILGTIRKGCPLSKADPKAATMWLNGSGMTIISSVPSSLTRVRLVACWTSTAPGMTVSDIFHPFDDQCGDNRNNTNDHRHGSRKQEHVGGDQNKKREEEDHFR